MPACQSPKPTQARAHTNSCSLQGEDLRELRRHVHTNATDFWAVKTLVQHLFPPCTCTQRPPKPEGDKTQGKPSAEVMSPGEAQAHNEHMVRCPGHKRALPVQLLVQALDMPEEGKELGTGMGAPHTPMSSKSCSVPQPLKPCCATLSCTPSVGWHCWHPPTPTATCTAPGALASSMPWLAGKHTPPQAGGRERGLGLPITCLFPWHRCPPLAVCLARQPPEDTAGGSCSVEFDVVELADSMGWELARVRQALHQLQWGPKPRTGAPTPTLPATHPPTHPPPACV